MIVCVVIWPCMVSPKHEPALYVIGAKHAPLFHAPVPGPFVVHPPVPGSGTDGRECRAPFTCSNRVDGAGHDCKCPRSVGRNDCSVCDFTVNGASWLVAMTSPFSFITHCLLTPQWTLDLSGFYWFNYNWVVAAGVRSGQATVCTRQLTRCFFALLLRF